MNIANLSIYYNRPSNWKEYVPYEYNPWNHYYSRTQYYMRHYPCYLKNVAFENIKKILFDNDFLPDCNNMDMKLDGISDLKMMIGLTIGDFKLSNSNLSNSGGNILNISNGAEVSRIIIG